jgi:hypothetical protein
MMIAKNSTEVYIALNKERYTDAYLVKFVDLSISDQI